MVVIVMLFHVKRPPGASRTQFDSGGVSIELPGYCYFYKISRIFLDALF